MSRRRMALFVAVLSTLLGFLTLTACGTVNEPRQSSAAATDRASDVRTFDSPRRTFVVEAEPDIGNVTFRGTVSGRDPVVVPAPADGQVLEVFFESGAMVESGATVLRFLPARTEAENIAVEIAELRIELAVAEGNPDAAAAAEQSLNELIAEFDGRSTTVIAPVTGTIGTTRQNVRYSVEESSTLFELSDPEDVVVDMTLGQDLDLVMIGTPVTLADTLATGDAIAQGHITEIDSDTQSARIAVTSPNDDLQLGDRVSVSLAAAAEAQSTWVPLEAVGRQNGLSFLLVANDSGRLNRIDVQLGQRTLTHAQVLSPLDIGALLVAP